MADRDKTKRTLDIYTRLIEGEVVNKKELAAEYGVTVRSISRDIEDIRDYMDDETALRGYSNSVIYDYTRNGFRVEHIYNVRFRNEEILAICKILLESRSLPKKEMSELLKKLISCCVPKYNQELVDSMIKNEMFHYIQPHHGKIFLDKMWKIAQAIHSNNYIEIKYTRLKGRKTVTRKLMPLAIMFSEYYFYLTAFLDENDVPHEYFDVINDSFPTIYRIDRIKDIKVLDEKYKVPYNNRFEEGEFRKRVQFMYGGKLRKIHFRYTGLDVNAILDRLPTAKIIKEIPIPDAKENEPDKAYEISAEVFGDGVDMWIRSQGERIKLLYD